MKHHQHGYRKHSNHKHSYRRKLYHIFIALACYTLLTILSSCGTAKQTPDGPSLSEKAENPSVSSSLVHAHDGHDYRHLIAKANLADLQLNQDTSTLDLKLQGANNVSFQPPLTPMFTGSTHVGMKLLIISAAGGDADPNLAGITYFAREIGVPYDVMIAKDTPLTTASLLDASGDGKYQGIILSDKSLVFNNNGVFESAFNDAEWNILWQYMREFGVRQVAMSGFPGASPEDYGLRSIDGLETGDTVIAKLTDQGSTIFESLKADADIPITGSFTYQAEFCGAACPDVTATTTPLLTHATTGNILAALSTTDDGRQIMTFTMNHNSFLRHTGLLAYDIINWVTDGIFIGERRMYYTLDIDDHYLASAVWNPATNSVFPTSGEGSQTFRLSATDLYAARDGVLDLRSRFNSPNFNYIQVFNADKADPTATVNCADNATLSEATLCVKDFFPWVSHTFTHAEMDFLTYNQSLAEFEQNIDFGEANLNFDRQFLVTGKHSGLGWYAIADAPAGATCEVDQVPGDPFCQFGLEASNTDMLRAAEDLGIKYLAANRGWDTHVAECDTCLITHPLNSNIKLVPRWPTNIFFNTSTPEENTSEFNYLYGPGGIVTDAFGNSFFDRALTAQEILDFEADIGLRHILSTSPYPHFIHQGNLREYSPGRSLAYDLSEAIMKEYSQYFSLPLVSQTWAEMTDTLEKRTSFFNAGASGKIDILTKAVTITSANGGTVFVTGVNAANATTFTYGNVVSELELTANQTVTLSGTTANTNNLLTNGDFESLLTGWSLCNSIPIQIGGTATNVDITLAGNGTGGACLYQSVTATAGEDYTLMCDAVRNQNTTWSSMALVFQSSDFVTIADSIVEITNTNLSPMSISLTAPANTAYVAATLYGEDSATVDDCVLTAGSNSGPAAPTPTATPGSYKYDLGTATSPVEAGYARLTASGLAGVSFSSTTTVRGINRTGTALNRDFVGSRGSGTFNHVLANGTYQVTVVIGEANAKNAVTIAAEDITMANAISILAGERKTVTAVVAVTDGELNIDFSAGTQWWTPNAIVITPIPTLFAYDLGTSTSPVEAGYTRLTTTTTGDVSISGTGTFRGISRNTGGNLNRDFIGSSGAGTFNQVLANGTYEVTLTFGEASYKKGATTAVAEGVTIANAVGTNAGEFKTVTATVLVTDGALNINFTNDDTVNGWWAVTTITISSIQ